MNEAYSGWQVIFLDFAKIQLREEFGLISSDVFFSHRFGKRKGCLTKRAPDVWDSAAFSSIFLASSFFYISSIVHARPHAGNANR